ncbi:helix-turn-helix transcriptional regulator [Microbacterium sp. LB16]|uniref:helix-turn-helix transcriptional regulator n=1 Tax=Microbacterium sp. LB16 TaxID=3081271 RepID=UPI00301CC4C7
MSALPSPLPLVPAIARRFDGLDLDERDRLLLLAVAVCLDDALDPLIEFDGRSAVEIAGGPVGERLTLHAGRVRFVDARLAIWVRATTCAAGTAGVHTRLSVIFDRCGDQVGADWHRARASLEGSPETAPELTRIARRLVTAGHADRALVLAREAAEHATGPERDEARLIAGSSSLSAGLMADAAAWLGSLYPRGVERCRLEALGGLFVAQAFTSGVVPHADLRTMRPRTGERDDWRSWARAAAFAAFLCAERGERREMRAWLDALRDAAMPAGAERELRDPIVALSWLILGERDIEQVAGRGPLTGGMLEALQAGMDGDIDRGLQLLAEDDTAVAPETDPLVPGYERSPVVRAYRAVVEVLLLVWRGDIGLARARLVHAALAFPVALPFAGLGVVLARRLDLAVLGELGPFARALTTSLPVGVRIDVLVDRAIRSFLAGEFDDAACTIRLWVDLGSPQTAIAVPGLDELALLAGDRPDPVVQIEPPEMARAERLRTRIATADDRQWRSEREEVDEAARTLHSPFARARVESMLGTRHAIRDDHVAARIHFQYAERLFELSGATAWARAIRNRLDRLDAREGSVVPAADPLSVCRRAWSFSLTARELEVAMRAVNGAGNRDIAGALHLSVRTVEVHLGRVFTKLDVRSRVELTVLAHHTARHL